MMYLSINMEVAKTIQTSVVLADARMYSPDINAVVLDWLKNKFEGKNYMGCHVKEVTEILERGRLTISAQRQNGTAMCSVRFKVRGIVYNDMQPVHNCVVLHIDKAGHMICKNQHAALFMQASPLIQKIKIGQTIVAIAGKAQYTILRNEISINALPFVYIKPTVRVYALTKVESPLIDDLLRAIDDHKVIANPDVYAYFVNMMSLPNKTTKLTTFQNAAKLKTLIVSRPDWVLYNAPLCLLHDRGEETTTEPYELIMGGMLQAHLDRLELLDQLCATYHSMELIRANANLWDIYTRNKV